MTQLRIDPVLAFSDNYIWVLGRPGSTKVAVIDPGDAVPVLEHLASHGLHLEAVLVTRHHGDHVGGVLPLVAEHPAPVYGPAREQIPGLTRPVREGERVELPEVGLELRVFDTPGHTAGHVCYLGEGALFSGDTLFTGGCGRVFEGTPEQMHGSIQKLAALPDETRVYCSHEYTLSNLKFARAVEPGSEDLAARLREAEALRARNQPTVPAPLALERRTNPFLRGEIPAVREAAARHAPAEPLTTPTQVFAVLRAWKNAF